MRRLCCNYISFLAILGCLCQLGTTTFGQQAAVAPKSAEWLVPSSTKGFLSVPNVDAIENSWAKIGLGKLVADPKVEPFINDLRAQVQTRLDRTGIRIGLSIDDLVEVCAGEVAIAFVLPKSGPQKHAVAAIADISGKEAAVKELQAKVQDSMEKRKAERNVKNVDGVEMVVYTIPIKQNAKKTFDAVLFEFNDRLVAVDHEEIAVQILNIMKGKETNDVLARHAPYVKTMNRCTRESNGLAPHLKWYVEPLGYARIAREAAAIQRNKRSDIIDALSKEGFDAVQGAGGYLNLSADKYELLHRSYVYAPAVTAAGKEKYERSARVLAFPGDEELTVQEWVPNTISSYASGTWKIQDAYEFVGTLVDEIAGAEGFWEDLKASLLEDPNGPQIDLDKEIIAHLGERATIMTDCDGPPITPKSERFLVAISLNNAAAMEKGIAKMFKTDPGANPVEIDDHTIWEIINEEVEAPVVAVEGGDGFSPFQFESDGGDEDDDQLLGNQPLMTNAAISVVEGHLMISSHVEFIVEIIRREKGAKHLGQSKDYAAIRKAMSDLGSKKDDIIRVFSRTDEELQATYEFIREGRMPESEGLLGSLLNNVFGSKEKGVVRDQKIDGENMPEYKVVRDYLGPLGIYVQAEDDGWYGVGIALAKEVNPDGGGRLDSDSISTANLSSEPK